MFICPTCKHNAHKQTVKKMTERVKLRYYTCTYAPCSERFTTYESVHRIMRIPEPKGRPADD